MPEYPDRVSWKTERGGALKLVALRFPSGPPRSNIVTLSLIQNLPDDSTLEDIQYHLYVRENVERGLRDLKSKRTVSQREVALIMTQTTIHRTGRRPGN